jgi:hypothetical protein
MGATSTAPPATRPAPVAAAWPAAGGWLRITLLAAVVAALVTSAFGYLVAEPLLDDAIRLEGLSSHSDTAGAVAVPEPFGRDAQKGGLVVAQLIWAAGVAFVLAGIAAVAGPGRKRARAPRAFLLGVIAAVAFASFVLPAATYPPLPPGAETVRDISERQLLWVGLVALGLAGALAAATILRQRLLGRTERLALAAAVLGGVVAIAVLGFPSDPLAAPYADPALLDRFRAASIGGQALFWAVLAGTAWALLRSQGSGTREGVGVTEDARP